MDEISAIDLFFKSHHILFSRPWLESCINWCKEEDLPPNYSEKDLRLKVFEQWLLCDLRDVEIPSLPPNLSSKVNYTLTGSFSLQLMKVIDISKPKFWQIQRIRNGVAKNLDQEVESSKRVLMLTLTDGVQEIEATELRPIPCLNLNLSPGIKITLTGPIEVRWGRLMLEDKHVNVRGGEVESLLVENAAENILAKHLNLPLNPEPNIIQESLLTANTEIFNETGVTTDGINATHNTSTRNTLTNQQPSFGPNTNNQINLSIRIIPGLTIQLPLHLIQWKIVIIYKTQLGCQEMRLITMNWKSKESMKKWIF
ncbi:hypothetical protein JTB14_035648 [Gonioctena quinquepunctata]|nr:hypothetical protein JTB14_035648 [Gonioctena quinquepunctata]